MTRVRDGRPADRSTLFAIQSTALAEPWPDLLALAIEGPPLLLVAEPDDEPGPVGYALAVTDTDSSCGASDTESGEVSDAGSGDGRAGYLAELAVAPGARGAGHGSALLDALADRLRGSGVDRLRVTVRVVDERALSFYQSRGFERRERLPDHYESGAGLLLVRDLDG